MKLPKYLLKDFSYYTHTTKNRSNEILDVVTVHYRPWWKWSKKFKFERTSHYTHADPDVCTYKVTPGCVDLVDQLHYLQEEQNGTRES